MNRPGIKDYFETYKIEIRRKGLQKKLTKLRDEIIETQKIGLDFKEVMRIMGMYSQVGEFDYYVFRKDMCFLKKELNSKAKGFSVYQKNCIKDCDMDQFLNNLLDSVQEETEYELLFGLIIALSFLVDIECSQFIQEKLVYMLTNLENKAYFSHQVVCLMNNLIISQKGFKIRLIEGGFLNDIHEYISTCKSNNDAKIYILLCHLLLYIGNDVEKEERSRINKKLVSVNDLSILFDFLLEKLLKGMVVHLSVQCMVRILDLTDISLSLINSKECQAVLCVYLTHPQTDLDLLISMIDMFVLLVNRSGFNIDEFWKHSGYKIVTYLTNSFDQLHPSVYTSYTHLIIALLQSSTESMVIVIDQLNLLDRVYKAVLDRKFGDFLIGKLLITFIKEGGSYMYQKESLRNCLSFLEVYLKTYQFDPVCTRIVIEIVNSLFEYADKADLTGFTYTEFITVLESTDIKNLLENARDKLYQENYRNGEFVDNMKRDKLAELIDDCIDINFI